MIAVLYFVLLRFLWSKMSNIFYERFLIYTLSLTLYLNSHYLCAKWNGNKKIRRKDAIIGAILIFYFCMNCIDKKKKKTLFHFTSANCLLFVSTLSGKGKTQSFLNRYICCLTGFLGEIVRGRFVTAPFVYSTCKMSVPDGNYSISTILFSENNVHKTIVCLPCTEYIFYGIVYTVGFIP